MERVQLGRKLWGYRSLARNKESGRDEMLLPKMHTWRYSFYPRYLAIIVVLVVIIGGLGVYMREHALNIGHIHWKDELSLTEQICKTPRVRREWRTLESHEQETYISAVQCLMHHPSIFDMKTTAYDDFIFAHSKTGSYSHYAAAFLPWHRMYVYLFEQALRTKCEYAGAMPFWDWTLDAHDLSSSPVWDETYGFGGNGDIGSTKALHHGHCVRSGPFANTTRAWNAISEGHSHDVGYKPHCLSRGFLSEDPTVPTSELNKLHRLISPGYVDKTLDQPDFESFYEMFEGGAHNVIPQFVRGDFLTFTAPNDPVFFLHHTQVDRLWWLWQQRNRTARLTQFHGLSKDFRYHDHGSSDSALTDVLPTGGLTKEMRVVDFMNTESGLLCYIY